MVYGENGRTALYLDAKITSLRFWLRLTRIEDERLTRKAYSMFVNIHNNRKQRWASGIRMHLMMYGFGDVWIKQGVNCVLRVFKERIISDCWKQGWGDQIQERDRYSVHRF